MPGTNSGDLNELFADRSAIAIVHKQRLRPVEGHGSPFFPPTYLGANDEPTYCISALTDGKNLCVVDSVQSQANRIEEAFMHEPYRALVRRVEITTKLANDETQTLDMLELGHRLADAAVRYSGLKGDAESAMRAFERGKEEGPVAIARLSPMSLLCGMWESRGETTQLKIPRAFSSTITARDVRELRRMATFTGSFWSKDLGLDEKHSEEGLDPVPAGEALGGVIAGGEILRTATLNLIALRQNCKVVPGQTVSPCARYVFGLGLVALSIQPEFFLRQGCLLVPNGDAGTRIVRRDGTEESVDLSHGRALQLAAEAAREFGVPALEPVSATFDKGSIGAKQKADKGKKPRGG